MDIIDQIHDNNISRDRYPFARNRESIHPDVDIDLVSTVPERWFQGEGILSDQLISTEIALSPETYTTIATDSQLHIMNATNGLEAASLLQPQSININQIENLEARLYSLEARLEASEYTNRILQERLDFLYQNDRNQLNRSINLLNYFTSEIK